jgi:hypothetical protein
MTTWRSRVFALAIALAANLIILVPMLTNAGRNLWANDVEQPRTSVITLTHWTDLDRGPAPKNTSLSGGPRPPTSNTVIHRAEGSGSSPSAPAAKPAITPNATSDISAAVRQALQGLAACSASRREGQPSEQRDACQRDYAKAPGELTSAAFIDPLKRAQYDAVAQTQEAKRAMMLGPIPDGYVACTGSRSNAMFGCPPPPRPKTPAANLWEASAPSTNPRGDP